MLESTDHRDETTVSETTCRAQTRQHVRANAPATPQCAHPITREPGATGYPRPASIARQRSKMQAKGMNPDQCARSSSYAIGERHYCGTHAALMALQAMVEIGQVRQLEMSETRS